MPPELDTAVILNTSACTHQRILNHPLALYLLEEEIPEGSVIQVVQKVGEDALSFVKENGGIAGV